MQPQLHRASTASLQLAFGVGSATLSFTVAASLVMRSCMQYVEHAGWLACACACAYASQELLPNATARATFMRQYQDPTGGRAEPKMAHTRRPGPSSWEIAGRWVGDSWEIAGEIAGRWAEDGRKMAGR